MFTGYTPKIMMGDIEMESDNNTGVLELSGLGLSTYICFHQSPIIDISQYARIQIPLRPH